jgi:sigma-B regulation protein RsbU (phosphoserine phosphatase)
VNAGHNPPILCRESDGIAEILEAGTTILGAFETLPFLEIGSRDGLQQYSIHLYTDGLTEAMNPQEEEYGEERFREFVERHSAQHPEDFHVAFRSAIGQFSQQVPLHDDLTLLSLRFF